MNKKISIILISLLTGCISYTIPADDEILKQNSITYTLDNYNKYRNIIDKGAKEIKKNRYGKKENIVLSFMLGLPTYGLSLLAMPFILASKPPYNYTTLAEENAIDCLYLYEQSDKCILYRRNHKIEDSKIAFFDYKRFLPKDSIIKTDDDFLLLFDKYKKNKKDCDEIYLKNNLTFQEKEEEFEKCNISNNELDNNLNLYIIKGIEREKNKRKSIIADCKQAINKLNNIGIDNLINFSGNKIIDMNHEGVFIYSLIYNNRVFIYTNGSYVNGDYFKDDRYYKYAGIYKYNTISGGVYSVYSYKPTKYYNNSPELDIKTYLKNKNITECFNSFCYKENNEEICFEEN